MGKYGEQEYLAICQQKAFGGNKFGDYSERDHSTNYAHAFGGFYQNKIAKYKPPPNIPVLRYIMHEI